jgi:hypothetical protein
MNTTLIWEKKSGDLAYTTWTISIPGRGIWSGDEETIPTP